MMLIEDILGTRAAASVEHALARWYDEHPGVLRLYAVDAMSSRSGARALRVVVILRPSGDGNEIGPRWMAHGATWTRELRQRLGRGVELESIDGPVDEASTIEPGSRLIAAICWRDPTVLEG